MAQTSTHHVTVLEDRVRKQYVSWDRGEAEREWACLSLLARYAPGIAPRPLARETHGGAPVVVMERLPGRPLGPSPLTDEQTSALGRTLRRMYDLPLAAAVTAGVPPRVLGPNELWAQLPAWLASDADLSQCQDPRLVAEAICKALEWLEHTTAPSTETRSIGIADLNPANVLWDGADCRLVDFEDGGLTDPAYELADHVEHIASRLAKVYDAGALASAAGLSADDRQRMDIYRPLWAGFWLVMLLPGHGGFRRNPPGTTEDQANHVLALLA